MSATDWVKYGAGVLTGMAVSAGKSKAVETIKDAAAEGFEKVTGGGSSDKEKLVEEAVERLENVQGIYLADSVKSGGPMINFTERMLDKLGFEVGTVDQRSTKQTLAGINDFVDKVMAKDGEEASGWLGKAKSEIKEMAGQDKGIASIDTFYHKDGGPLHNSQGHSMYGMVLVRMVEELKAQGVHIDKDPELLKSLTEALKGIDGDGGKLEAYGHHDNPEDLENAQRLNQIGELLDSPLISQNINDAAPGTTPTVEVAIAPTKLEVETPGQQV